MKQLFPILTGVFLCLFCTAVAFIFPEAHAFSYITLILATVTGLMCIGGILHFVLRGGR